MITKDNIKELIQTIEPSIIDEAVNSEGDFILLEAHIFNTGSYATINSMNYDEGVEAHAAANGNLFIDKDTFIYEWWNLI
jgi:hypothetical protein